MLKPVPSGLDKSVPFEKIVMRFPAEKLNEVECPSLPEGYTFHMYEPGDRKMWSELETSVDEFPTVAAGEAYFDRDFMPHEGQLPSRMMFVLAPDGTPAGTCTAWYTPDGDSMAHWMSVLPAHQGHGLSRSMMQWVLYWYRIHEPGKDVYLKTQTWSYKAIGLYLRMGYRAVAETCPILASANQYSAAKEVLKDILPPETWRDFCDAVE